MHPESYRQLEQLVKLHGMAEILRALRQIALGQMGLEKIFPRPNLGGQRPTKGD
jgi:hypothetical protein